MARVFYTNKLCLFRSVVVILKLQQARCLGLHPSIVLCCRSSLVSFTYCWHCFTYWVEHLSKCFSTFYYFWILKPVRISSAGRWASCIAYDSAKRLYLKECYR
ncbi:hypothetical protein BDR05DRAFT_406122 [Suillus weaverae]|nr:hypothetical protein BDR05DRAFT_406122 [Suillus weaverae]